LFHSKEQQACKRNNNCSIQRNNRRAKGTTIVPFKGTTGAQKEQQLFHSKEQQARKRNNNCSIQRNKGAQKEQQLFRSKEQQACKRNNNCSIQRNNRRKKQAHCSVQRNSRRAKGTTIVPFKPSEFVETWYVFCLNSRLIPHQLSSFMSWFISKLSNGWFVNVINFIIVAQLPLLNHDIFISLQKTGYG
jgi:hypothetical protein